MVPKAPRVCAALVDVRRQYPPPPTASHQRPWTPPSLRRWCSRAPKAPLAGALLQGGAGGVAHTLTLGPLVPSSLHGCYLYVFIYEYVYKYPPPPPPPTRHGHFDQHVG